MYPQEPYGQKIVNGSHLSKFWWNIDCPVCNSQ